MAKDSDGRSRVCRNPFFVLETQRKEECMKTQSPKNVIAYRKTCQPKGTGLSHYILMDRKVKK
jgi:modified peptide precursor CbpA